MSTLKTNNIQIGQSATATQNFTWSVPVSPDGTIKLARGNQGATTQDILSVDASGNMIAGANIRSLSDASKKTNVSEITNAVDVVSRLTGVEFDWVDSNQHSAGVIAQQVESVIPFLVGTDSDGLKSVDYNGIIAYLIQANKELAARVQALENK